MPSASSPQRVYHNDGHFLLIGNEVHHFRRFSLRDRLRHWHSWLWLAGHVSLVEFYDRWRGGEHWWRVREWDRKTGTYVRKV